MHRLLIFTVLNNPVVVRTLDALEAGLALTPEVAENVLDLILEEVVRTSLVVANVKVLTKLRQFLRRESQLSQIVPAIISEVEDSSRRKLVIDLASHGFVLFRRDG